MHIVLFEPEIPPNTGSIARLCAATKTPLHLIEPLGFSLEDKYLKRAGLDYWPYVDISVWKDWDTFVSQANPGRIVLSSARKGEAFHEFSYTADDWIVLGPETRGLPEWLYEKYDCFVRIPIWGKVRSINISNAASVLLYESLRQTGELSGK